MLQYYSYNECKRIYIRMCCIHCYPVVINTFRPRQNGRHFPDDIYKCMFLNENIWISIKISLKFFVPKGRSNNIPVLFHIMAWRRPGDTPLCETFMVRLSTHICVTRPQWVNTEWVHVIYVHILSMFFRRYLCSRVPQYLRWNTCNKDKIDL